MLCRFLIKRSLLLIDIMHLSSGSLKNDDGNGDENGKKAIRLDWQNNNFARASRPFVHFFAVAARLQGESAYLQVLSRKGTPDINVLCTCTHTLVYFYFRSFGKHLRARERG